MLKELFFRAPGFFRTVTSVLLVAAEVAEQAAPVVGGDLKGAAAITAAVGLVRALARKFTK